MGEIKMNKTHLIAVVVLIDGYVEDTCWRAGNLGFQVTVQKPVVDDRVAACRNDLERRQAITAYGISFIAIIFGKCCSKCCSRLISSKGRRLMAVMLVLIG